MGYESEMYQLLQQDVLPRLKAIEEKLGMSTPPAPPDEIVEDLSAGDTLGSEKQPEMKASTGGDDGKSKDEAPEQFPGNEEDDEKDEDVKEEEVQEKKPSKKKKS